MDRRTFVRNSVAAGAVLGWPGGPASRVLGANDDIRVAIVGFHGKGRQHIGMFKKMKGVRLVALCDADEAVLNSEKGKLAKSNIQVDGYTDVRKLLENKDIDAVVTATPNHWHSLLTVWACQAGKDVYVEKPLSHSLWEGGQAVAAARKYQRIVQHGTQNRSDVGLLKAYKYIADGNLGKLLEVRGFCYRKRGSIGKVDGPQPIPSSVNYDLWCGPSPKGPLMRKRLHYDWHWVWPTGNGDIGNQGIHEFDLCRWAFGMPEGPVRCLCIGGRFVWNDDGETPNAQIAVFDMKPVPMIFEVRDLHEAQNAGANGHYRGIRVGVVLQCENGYFAGGRGGGWVYDNDGKRVKGFKGDGGGGHQANFIKAVRSRKVEDLHADILEGHRSCTLFHVANASLRVGKKTPDGEIREQVKGNALANEWYERLAEDLRKNGVNIEASTITLGPWLEYDTKTEKIVNNEAANALLNYDYRAPFVVPKEV